MHTHIALIKLFLSLGYAEMEGACRGIAIRWLEAQLLNEAKLFDARINRIKQMLASKVDVVALVNSAKAKKGKNLTRKDKEC